MFTNTLTLWREENCILQDGIWKVPCSRAFGYPLRQAGDQNRLGLEIGEGNRSRSDELFQETCKYR